MTNNLFSTANADDPKMLKRMDGEDVAVLPAYVALIVPSNNPSWSIVRMASGHAIVVMGTVVNVRKAIYGK